MTVINCEQNKINCLNKKNSFKIKKRNSKNISKGKKILMAINLFLFIASSFLVSFNCNFTTQSTSLRIDIQSLEKETLSFEEKNAQLKTEISQIQNSHQFEMFAEKYIEEFEPKYFVFSKKKVDNEVSILNYEY
jgi:cell division protein FtsL